MDNGNLDNHSHTKAAETDFQPIHNPYNPYDFKAGRSYYNKAVTERIKSEFEAAPPRKMIFLQGSEGSGKSSTLNRIKNDSRVLGERYLTLYIHTDDIASKNDENSLLNLYENLRKSVEKFVMHSGEDVMRSLKVSVTAEDFQELFTVLESEIDCAHTLVLVIFDDFDKFLEQEKSGDLSRIMKFFSFLLDRKPYIRIILSGRGEIPGRFRYTELGRCLDNQALPIKMKTVDDHEFNRAVTQPVENVVHYTKDALKKIREITGGNLYCQQLLCYYVIYHLNSEQKTACDVDNVTWAAEMAINDVREDFNYFWEKMSVEDRLVCSAIMDANIVRPSGSIYFVEQTSLLYEVFEPEELKSIFARLYENDYINRLRSRRFDGFPFKIPLYGNWIRLVHPFPKTIVENLESIAQLKSLTALGTIIENLPLLSFPISMQNIVRFIQEWSHIRKLLNDQGRVNKDEIAQPLTTLCNILDLEIKENGSPSKDYFTIDFEKLDIGSVEEAIFFFQDRRDPGKDDIQHLKDTILADVTPTKPCLFFCFKKNERIEELVQKAFLNFILVDDTDVKNVLFSSRPRQTLKEIVFHRISISQISPYKTEGPAIATFYGRNKELRKILGSHRRSFTILGARKIGKSSLLRRLDKELHDMGAHVIYMDLESPANPDHTAFLQRMEGEINRVFRTDVQFGDSIDRFTHEVKELPKKNKKLVFIMDEIDELLLYDKARDFRLVKALRSLFHEGYCQFVFSGFEVLQNVKRDIQSPLYNFCEEILLGPLEEKFAVALIKEPMANMGVRFEEDDAIRLILEYTTRHPNLIQFFCKHLVENLDENAELNKERKVYPGDIRELYNYQYDNYIVNDFYMFYHDLDELEKLMIILLYEAHGDRSGFSLHLVNRLLKECGIDLSETQLHKTLQKLVLRFLLIDMGKGIYRFALPHFPEMLGNRVEPPLKSSLVQRVKEGYYAQPV